MSGVATAIAGSAIIGGISSNQNSKRAINAQEDQNARNEQFIREQAIKARGDVLPLYDAARENRGIGTQAAMDVVNDAMPEMSRLLREGNLGAQQTLLAGLPQANNAILGLPVDYNALQPQEVSPSYAWALRSLPQFINPTLPEQTLEPAVVAQSGGASSSSAPLVGGLAGALRKLL